MSDFTQLDLGLTLSVPTCCQCGAAVEGFEPRDFDDISGPGKVYCAKCDIFRNEENGDENDQI